MLFEGVLALASFAELWKAWKYVVGELGMMAFLDLGRYWALSSQNNVETVKK